MRTFYGTNQGDRLLAPDEESSFRIYGYAGNDEIHGAITSNSSKVGDYIYAGSGNDTVFGYSGWDVIWGEDGDDSLLGAGGADIITGDIGDDTIKGGAGGDQLSDSSGNDSILGGNGSDSITGGIGADFIGGGAGADTLYGNSGSDTIIGGGGMNEIYAGVNDYSVDQIFVNADATMTPSIAPRDGRFQDHLYNLEIIDEIVINGVYTSDLEFSIVNTSVNDVRFNSSAAISRVNQIGIYANGVLEAVVLDNAYHQFSISDVQVMTQGALG